MCEVEVVAADDMVFLLVGWKHQLLTYLLSYLLTYLLAPWSRVPLEKLTGFQLLKKHQLLTYLLTYLHTYLLTYVLTCLLHGAESLLRS